MPPSNRPQRINDPAVHDAARRLDWFTRMVDKRLSEYRSAADRTERVLAMLEADAAAKLVEAACHEVALRLVIHRLASARAAAERGGEEPRSQISLDPVREIGKRLAAYRLAKMELEYRDGPVALA